MTVSLFPHNEAIADRAVRIAGGLAVLSLVIVGPHSDWGYLGLVPLLTGLIGTCPLYTLLGFSTCPAPKAP